MLDFEIRPDTTLGKELHSAGISRFAQLLERVRNLPYGRNRNRRDPGLVWTEQRGTCSSKHAFLKQVAEAHGQVELKLVLGMYRMSAENTPGIGRALEEAGLEYVPEAHCYLKYRGEVCDVTNGEADFERVRSALMEEREIEWEQVGEWKVTYHRLFLEKWRFRKVIPMSLEELWAVREDCIANLAD